MGRKDLREQTHREFAIAIVDCVIHEQVNLEKAITLCRDSFSRYLESQLSLARLTPEQRDFSLSVFESGVKDARKMVNTARTLILYADAH